MKVDALTVTHWTQPGAHLPVIRRRLVRRLRYHGNRKARAKAKAYARDAYQRDPTGAKAQMRQRYMAVALLRAVLNILEPRPGRAYVKADCPRAALVARGGWITAVPAGRAVPAAPSA
jgi:hypothetical protein